MSSPSSWWCLRRGMPPGILPLPPKWRRALPPILVISFIFCFLKAMQGWQRFFEVRAMTYGHRVRTHKIRTYPPIATIYVEFFFCSNMGEVLVRQFVHLADHFFSATQFQHGFSEPCITNESIVKAQELSFLTPFGVDLQCGILYLLLAFRSGDLWSYNFA